MAGAAVPPSWERRLRRLLRPPTTGDAEPLRRAAASRFTAAAVLGGACYGLAMGGFGGWAVDRWPQLFYSAVKVPILLLVTGLLTLPGWFVVQSLLGLRDDTAAALRAVLGTQVVVAIVLASLAPLTAVLNTAATYDAALFWNLACFAVATLAGQFRLRRAYQPLIAKNPMHRRVLLTWLGVYAFTGIQMAWTLRPFVGAPGVATRFLRPDAWGNAYVEIWELLRRFLFAW